MALQTVVGPEPLGREPVDVLAHGRGVGARLGLIAARALGDHGTLGVDDGDAPPPAAVVHLDAEAVLVGGGHHGARSPIRAGPAAATAGRDARAAAPGPTRGRG